MNFFKPHSHIGDCTQRRKGSKFFEGILCGVGGLCVRQFLILFAICSFAVKSQGQVFPIQVNTSLQPPYSPYVADYTASGAQKLMVQLRANDLQLTDYLCKFRLTIEGVGITIRTKPTFVPQPITFYGGGAPQILYGEDLYEYFNPNNLDFSGISRAEFSRTGKLPEGVYRFTIEVLDYNRGTVVSNKGIALAWVILNDPPLLNLPRKDTKVRILDPTNIPFTWTPRHTGSPNSAFSTEYVFRLVEIWPLNRNPYDAFLSQPPLYEVTTSQTQIIYGPAEPALIPGRKYAWQVQASDTEGRDLFKNQGRSEVYVFQFGDALGMPENVRLQSANPSTLNLRWDQSAVGSSDPLQYRLRYRPKSNAEGQWYEAVSTDQWKALALLQPNTEYEVQVRAEQAPQTSEYSPVRVFKTLPAGENQFVCKDNNTPPPAPDNTIPTFPLRVNDTIRAGGYDVLVREVTANVGNSSISYTGRGVAIIPWFNSAKVRVTFENISVNQQFWLTSGEIKTVWDANSKFLMKVPGQTSPGGVTPQAGEIPVTIVATDSLIRITGAAIVSVTKNEEGNIVVQTSDGQTRVLEKGQSYSIVDDVGNGYVVDKEGNIVKTTATEALAANARGNRTYDIKLQFEKGDGKFGFDEKKYDALTQNYQQVEGGNYIAWKAVSSSQPDPVYAATNGASYDPQKVQFELNSSPVTATFNAGRFALNLTGKAEGMVEELLAYEDSNKEKVIGKLNVVSYDKIKRTVVIVPVNNNRYPYSTSNLREQLNKIYNQAVAEWTVIEDNNLTVTLGAEFDDGESGLFSNYTDDMKKVINAYTKDHSLVTDTYYLFMVANPRSKIKEGYMPRKKQAGFIFVDKVATENKAIKTIAHELAHGAFRLKHTFSEYPALSQGSTDNLMDYAEGTALYKYQWDNVHNPEAVLGLFEGDEAGAMGILHTYCVPDNSLVYKWIQPNEIRTYLTPSGKPIRFSKIALLSNLLFGGFTCEGKTSSEIPSASQQTLSGFTLDGLNYVAVIDIPRFFGSPKFLGYALIPTNTVFDLDKVDSYTYYNQGNTSWESSVTVSIPANRQYFEDCALLISSVDFSDKSLIKTLPCPYLSIDIARSKELNSILTQNLAELAKPILIKVMGPKSWALENRRFYLDPREQEKNESTLRTTSGGALYFKIDDDGYINLNEIYANEQRASVGALVELGITLEEFLVSITLFWNIYNNSAEYSSYKINGKPKSEILLEEAKEGEVSDIQLISAVVALRKQLTDKFSLEKLTADELRLTINLLFNLQQSLKYTFGTESSYPFSLIQDLQKIKLTPLERYKIEPAQNDEELFKQLEYLYLNDRESMIEDEINLYFWLLCYVGKDCTGPDPKKYEDHHMIPQQWEEHELVVAARKCADKFLFNGRDNFIKLEKYVRDTGTGRHGNHPDYNEWIFLLLNRRLTLYRNQYGPSPIDPCKAKEILLDLIDTEIRPAINEDPNETINELGKRKLNKK